MSAPGRRPRLYARVTVVVVCLRLMFTDLSHAQTLTSLDALRREFAPIARPLDVLLIGKDGGLKRGASRLDVARLFTSIDRMPMRRREMRAGDGETGEKASRGR